jgi:hypothetical protein
MRLHEHQAVDSQRGVSASGRVEVDKIPVIATTSA